jgi:PadR family transcriptional regulator, regulatory protein PadR
MNADASHSRQIGTPEPDPHEHHGSHRGWVRSGGQRGRWLEPFLLLLLADGESYGGELIAKLNGLCLAPNGVDVGMAYRTLREFEADDLVASRWVTDEGAPRRTYQLTEPGRRELDGWAEVMRERARLTGEFLEMEGRLSRPKGSEVTSSPRPKGRSSRSSSAAGER